MTLKALTIVVLRLFAILFFIETLAATVTYVSALNREVNTILQLSIYPAGMLILAVLLWVGAHRLAALATKDIDGPIPFTALTREDIYCSAFVILGLNFALGSIGSTLLELYQYIQIFTYAYPENSGQNWLIAPLAKNAITLIAGLACILGAQAWTRKLLRLEKKNES